jgi:hypothetical protein
MKQFNKTVLAAAILLTLGFASSASATPANDQTGLGAIANDKSTATDNSLNAPVTISDSLNDNSDNSDHSDNSLNDSSDNSDHSDNSLNDSSDNSAHTDNSLNDNSANSIHSTASGDGAAASENGSATSNYQANNSELTGTVTGAGTGTETRGPLSKDSVPANNSIDSSLGGSAGVFQTSQNTGNNSLTQQQVSFQGNVDVNKN